jgi:hypothetical protein
MVVVVMVVVVEALSLVSATACRDCVRCAPALLRLLLRGVMLYMPSWLFGRLFAVQE